MDGFNTFEKQDKILLGLNSGSGRALRCRHLPWRMQFLPPSFCSC